MLRKKLWGDAPVSEGAVLDLSLPGCAPSDVSKYFPNAGGPPDLAERLLQIQSSLNEALRGADFLVEPPVAYVYNPTEYARAPFELYTRKYAKGGQKKVLVVGMNPGPFGMCQTGVPFGDVDWVRDWLEIEGPVGKPPVECPVRPVRGFACQRKEQSGDRFWKFFSQISSKPEHFFRHAFLYNYCPLAFMTPTGKNLTPSEIKGCKGLERICDKFYLEVLRALRPETIVAVGKYAEKRSGQAAGRQIRVLCLPHPSPRAAHNGAWPQKAHHFLDTNDLTHLFQPKK